MTAPASSCSPDAIAFAEDRFEAIEQYAEKQISLWLSIREGAWRRERETLELHCPQIRILTLATFDAVRELGAGKTLEAT
jgi:hypothetical protein